MLRVWGAASGEEMAALPVEEVETVLQLKQRLGELWGTPRFRLRILIDGATMEDNAPLESDVDVQLLVLPLRCPCPEDLEVFKAAAAAGKLGEVERMLQDLQDPDLALLEAARAGQEGVVQLLLEALAEPYSTWQPRRMT
eukprot:s1416_g6.t1